MKLLLLGGALLFFGGLFAPKHRAPERYTFLISGSAEGNLAPCGCTKPMSGGIKRKIAVIRALGSKGKDVIILENGGLVSGSSRQDEIKAEILSESLRTVSVTAINLTRSEIGLGPAMVESMQRLSGEAFTSASFEGAPAPHKLSGPFLIVGVSDSGPETSQKYIPLSSAVEGALATAKELNKRSILLLDGPIKTAETLARTYPEIYMIVFRSTGAAASEPGRVGSTWLVSPGEKAKQLIQVTGTAKTASKYSVIKLGPEVQDDEAAGRAYGRYLDRIVDEKLFERIPRGKTAEYVGSKACASCHAGAYEKWKQTGHAHALKTLELDRHDRDPDCVSCHVVGMESLSGFMNREKTPELADVGCESCHGAGQKHSADPKAYPFQKLGETACATCHTPDTSPNFDFKTYWEKVIHN
ncbi:MAG: cytochrome c family protein [Fimbriimonadaceae bacterium]